MVPEPELLNLLFLLVLTSNYSNYIRIKLQKKVLCALSSVIHHQEGGGHSLSCYAIGNFVTVYFDFFYHFTLT